MPTSQQFITRPAQELLGQNPGYGFAGLGVSTALGNFTQTTADLSFPPGLLGLLDWQRTYNSHSGAIGALGPGWTTSFSAHLVASPPQGLLHHTASPVTFYDEDGRVLAFTPAEGGGYNRPQDLAGDLARNADGSFTLTYNSGEVWSFDTSGRLSGRSLEGQQVSLDYSSDDLLLAARHSTGRQLAFSYDANRRLTSLQASDGRAVSFGYGPGTVNDALLESVTLPGGGVFHFESSGSGQASQIAKITNPDGNLVVANEYDATSLAVTGQQYPGGGGASFRYGTDGVTVVTSASTGAEFTFEANPDGRMVKLTDPAGNAATFRYGGSGYLSQATTPGGTRLVQTHDANGNLLSNNFGGSTTAWILDDADRVTSVTGPTGEQTTYAYTGSSHIPSQITGPGGGVTQVVAVNGLVASWTGPDGGTTTIGFDAAGDLTSVTGPTGETTQRSYDAAGNLTQMITPSGATSQWAYDGAGRVISFTGPDGAVTGFGYSPGGLLLEQTEPGGAVTAFGYDAAGNRTSITNPLGDQITFGHDPDGNLTSVTDADGGVTLFAYNNLGQITSTTNPVGAVAEFGYDADGNNVTRQDPSGKSSFTYDARGNPTSATDPTGATAHRAYDAADRITSLTDALGGLWQLGYDAGGNVGTITDPSGAAGQLAWTKADLLAGITDPLGRQVGCTRNAAGQVTETTDAAGGVTSYVHNADGRRISVTSPAGLITKYAYDAAGRIIATTDPRGWIARNVYDSRGQRVAVISPSGTVTSYGYDAAGHLTELTDGNGSVTLYGYDPAGRIVSMTDAKGAVTQYGYDAEGHLTSLTDPLRRTTLRQYDKAGNLTAIIDPSGHAQHMQYDGDGRLTQWTADDGSEVTFTYDKTGLRTSMTDVTGTTHYTYDSAGRLLTTTGPDGQVITAAYDQAGQRTSLAYPGGLTVRYAYDGNGRLIALIDSRAGDAVYALDPDGRLLTEQLPGRLARRYHYDRGLLRRFTVIRDGHPVAETEFTHDPDGRILTQRDGQGRLEFRYDRAGQLISASGDGSDGALHATYDAVGNRTSLRRGGRETRYRYDSADQLEALETDGRRAEFRYDVSGRLIEQTTTGSHQNVEYDGFGRPVAVTRQDGAFLHRAQATFDGDGLLAALALTSESEAREEEKTATVRYRWSAMDNFPQVLTQRANPAASDAAADDAERERVARLNADFAYGYGRTFASWQHGAVPLEHDAFGSAVRTADTEAWVQARSYGVFGAPDDPAHRGEGERPRPAPRDHRARTARPAGPPHGEGPAPHAPELPRFGYRGELALGPLLNLRARVYDTELGRFTTRDPLNNSPGVQEAANPYTYAYNDPVNYTDPLGLLAIAPLGGGAVSALSVAQPASRHQTTSTDVLTSTMLQTAEEGKGGDHSTVHNACATFASGLLAAQTSMIHHAPPLRVETELEISGAGKSRYYAGLPHVIPSPVPSPTGKRKSRGNGYADIQITYALFGQLFNEESYIWEVKSATIGKKGLGKTPWATEQTAYGEAKWYASSYMNLNPGVLAAPGLPLATPAFLNIPGYGEYIVYSTGSTLGAVLYEEANLKKPKPPNRYTPPFPMYDYHQKSKTKVVYNSGPMPQLLPMQKEAEQQAWEDAAFAGLGVGLYALWRLLVTSGPVEG